MVRRTRVLLLITFQLLTAASASPVLHQLDVMPDVSLETNGASLQESEADNVGMSEGHFDYDVENRSPSQDTTEPPSERRLTSQKWQGDLSPEDHLKEERVSPGERDAVEGFNGWDRGNADDALWKTMKDDADSPGYYEFHQQEPPPAELPVDDFERNGYRTDGSSRNNNISATETRALHTQTVASTISKMGPELGTEKLQESLGVVLTDSLSKMKRMLAQSGARDWRSELSRLRVKRSEDDSEESEEVSVSSLNDMLDVFLVLVRQSLEDRRLDQVSIPPLEQSFSVDLGLATLRGFFRGDDGWVRRLTTLKRAADVRLDRGQRPPGTDAQDVRTVSIATSLSLEELTVGFERYVADVRAVPTISGRMVADIEENKVLLNISLSKRDDDPEGCDVVLQELKVEHLDGIDLRLTGLGPLNWLLSQVATWLTSHSQEKVAAVVEKELTKIAKKEVRRIPCDANFIDAVSML